MQISIDTEILESIFTHATNAARLANDIDDGIIDDALTKSINEIHRVVAGMLGEPYDPQPTGEAMLDVEVEFDVASEVDLLCQLAARADAMAHATEELFEQVIVVDANDDDPRSAERLVHLLGATVEAVRATVEASDQLAVELATRRKAV